MFSLFDGLNLTLVAFYSQKCPFQSATELDSFSALFIWALSSLGALKTDVSAAGLFYSCTQLLPLTGSDILLSTADKISTQTTSDHSYVTQYCLFDLTFRS